MNNSEKVEQVVAMWRLAVNVVLHNMLMGKTEKTDEKVDVVVKTANKFWCHPLRISYAKSPELRYVIPPPAEYPNCCEYHKLLAPKDPAPIFYHVGLRQDALAAKVLTPEEFETYLQG